MDKVAAFCIGNAVGLTLLFGGVLLSDSRKMKEVSSQKQTAPSPVSLPNSAIKATELVQPKLLKNQKVGASSMFSKVSDTLPAKKETTLNVVASENLKRGHVLVERDLVVPIQEDTGRDSAEQQLLGKALQVDVKKGSILSEDVVQQ